MTDQNPPAQPDPYQPPSGETPPPPPPPSGYGEAPGAMPPSYVQPGYGAAQNGPGTTSLVLGIIGLLCCGILSIVAVVLGSKGKKLAAQGLATNGGVAQAGWILGWIGIALWIVGIIVQVALLAAGKGSFSFSTGT